MDDGRMFGWQDAEFDDSTWEVEGARVLWTSESDGTLTLDCRYCGHSTHADLNEDLVFCDQCARSYRWVPSR